MNEDVEGSFASHEGKACDAALRQIEGRLRSRRSNLSFPERERHSAPVEMACRIGGQLFAFEHTAIEPFPGFFKMQAEAKRDLRPLDAMLFGKLPATENFLLMMPVEKFMAVHPKARSALRGALAEWIVQQAPSLKIAKFGRYAMPIEFVQPPGVPFQVRLHRSERGIESLTGRFNTSLTIDNLEDRRKERLQETCRKKFPKLKAWKDNGARSVLVLEDRDIQLSNAEVVFEALRQLDRSDGMVPDEIYLIDSCVDEFWHVYTLRLDSWNYYELSESGGCLTEVDPKVLIDLTGR